MDELDEILDGDNGPPAASSSTPTKRPRLITSAAASQRNSKAKRIKRPVDYAKELATDDKRVCIFCELPGSIRECEGALCGPFPLPVRSRKKPLPPPKLIYAHRNCALWAPEVWDDNGIIRDLNKAITRANKKKCFMCGAKGASLGCLFNGSRCCRAMHFRCALQGGGALHGNFEFLCPNHAHKISNRTALHERTPIDYSLLFQGCTLCKGDSYDQALGSILTCAICTSRAHSKCLFPNIGNDGMFSLNSSNGKHYCKDCMRCQRCDNPIDTHIYTEQGRTSAIQGDLFDDSNASDTPEPNDSVLCVSCKHFSIHVRCLPPGDDHKQWRCDHCLICRHCNTIDLRRDEWNEKYEACNVCFTEIQNGGVVCPVCVKVYREHENVEMVQCDFCDKWIHAVTCGKLTKEEFKKIGHSDEKYRCPICVSEKKKRDVGRRKTKGSGKIANAARTGHLPKSVLQAILHQMPNFEEDIIYQTVCLPPKDKNDEANLFKSVIVDLAIGQEICRHCCSGGVDDLRFCSDCGESYHPFCHDAKAGLLSIDVCRTSGGAGSLVRGRFGRPDFVQASFDWQCYRCQQINKTSSSEHRISIQAITRPQDAGETFHGNGHSANGNAEPNGTYFEGMNCNTFDITNRSSADVREAPDAVAWPDKRVCELCHRKEVRKAPEGKLIPWASSTVSDSSNVWVHVGCVMWSSGVSVHGTPQGYDTLLAPRRTLLALAKRTQCIVCGSTGASLKCSAEIRCHATYHFHCARDVGVACVVNFTNRKANNAVHMMTPAQEGYIDLAVVEDICIYCPSHRLLAGPRAQDLPSLSEYQDKLRVDRVLRILDRQGYSPDSDPPRKRPPAFDRSVSLRVGSLSVIQFGDLIPEVSDFIVKGCLVPLGFCAARRFWSIVSRGRRCTYFLEVRGSALTGPKFVIRCSDIPTFRVEHSDPDVAWFEVLKRLAVLTGRGMMPDLTDHCKRKTGLEAYGLIKCNAVVSYIESMPMAAMFSGRYELKLMARHRNNTVLFFNSLAKNYRPVKRETNETGCARSEGFLPRRIVEKKGKKSISVPTYENARTGSAFQLEVAREVLSNKNDGRRMLEHQCIEGTQKQVMNPSNGRPRRSSSGEERKPPGPKVRSKKANMESQMVRPRILAPESKNRTRILRSNIDGWGVFATTDIAAGELIIEYVGEIIRPTISDLREKRYMQQGIGCYMFEIVAGKIVDATLCGNAARYINHSCAPNCYSKTIRVDNNRNVVGIFSKRRIQRGEELSYDYQFPFDESDRVECGCGAEHCKGFMN